MSKFMKLLNNISRSQAIYRRSRIAADDLQSGHYAFVLAICREPGRSQEELARELCINKSTAARNLSALEERGYISRSPLPCDKRQFAVFPTEKMLAVLDEVRSVSVEWMQQLSEGIPQEQLDVFDSVLSRMEAKAREIVNAREDTK